MKEEFDSLILAFNAEQKSLSVAVSTKDLDGMLRGLATIASIIGSMRAIREISAEEIEKANLIEAAESAISNKIIPAIKRSIVG